MTRFKLQPREGGANEHCSVPLCSVSSKYNGVVSFHSFPVDVELRKRWLVAVRRDNFTVTKHTKVCSTHFAERDFVEGKIGGRQYLKRGVVPTVFAWNWHVQKRPGVWERRLKPPAPTEEDEEQGALPMDCSVSDPVQTHDYCAVPEPAALDVSLMANHEHPSMSEPKSTESPGSGCGVPAQRSSQQGPEMVSVKVEDCSQPLKLNVIVKEEEEERGIEEKREGKEEKERAVKEEERAVKEEERAVKEEERAVKEEERAVKKEEVERAVKEEEGRAVKEGGEEEERAVKEEEHEEIAVKEKKRRTGKCLLQI